MLCTPWDIITLGKKYAAMKTIIAEVSKINFRHLACDLATGGVYSQNNCLRISCDYNIKLVLLGYNIKLVLLDYNIKLVLLGYNIKLVLLGYNIKLVLLGYNKGNNKITELRTILQRESQNS
jgi:hypothetical protein